MIKNVKKLENNLAGIMLLCDLINIYYYNSVKDHKYQRKQIEDRSKKIKAFANAIKHKELGQIMKVVPGREDVMENEHALHLWRIFDYFMLHPTDRLAEFADSLDGLAEK